MPAIFISHSGKDRNVSDDIKAALTRLGFEQAFLDFDKETGLDIGENWEKRLYAELTRCHAVVLVLTPTWLASKWCFAELTQARALGKVILPVLCEPVEGRLVLPDIQAVDLVDWNAGGLERLERRLRAISDELARGFALDPTRPPYPGINAFEKEDAAIYFGRDEESRAVIERLDARRTQGGARFVIIVGASGSGKSSLLKASVLPLLNRRRVQWAILPDIRPEKAPIEVLAKALAEHIGKPETWRDWHDRLSGPDAVAALERVVQDARIGEARSATVLLPIDQFEECFTTTPATERAAFLGLLQAAFGRDLPFMVIATGRSDVLEGLIESSELSGHYETFPLTAMPPERYPRLIEGPAAVAGITVEKGLSERIGRDVESREALPLLAHMLALLQQRGAADKRLSLAEYEALGDSARGLNPIQNSIRLAADEAITRVKPSERELDALRDAFVPHLVRVRLDDGKRVRQTARRSELPAESLRLIGALTEARLLTTRSSDAEHEPLVEVTHEALFKAWPALDRWLTEQQAFLTDLERIRAAHENYANAPQEQKSGELLYGLLLSRARDWLLKYPQRFISRDMEPLRAYIAASAEVADAERARTQRVRRLSFAALTAAVIGFAAFGFYSWNLYVAADEAKKLAQTERNLALITQSRFLADRANDVFDAGDVGTAIAVALEALPDERRGIKRPYVAKAESMLYRAVMALREQKTLPVALESAGSLMSGAEVSSDGRRVLIRSSRQTGLFAAETGAEIKRISDQQTDIDDASFTRDARWVVTTARDNVVRVYRADDGDLVRKLPMQLPDGAGILEYAASPDGRHVVATSRRGPAHLWNAEAGTLIRTLPDSLSVSPGAFSPDGQWLATSDNDQIRVWRIGADTPPLVIGEIKQENRDEPHAYFFPDSKRLLTATRNGLVQVFDIEQRKPINTLFEDKLVSSASFSPDGRWLVLTRVEELLVFAVADLVAGSDIVLPLAHKSHSASALAFAPDSSLAATASGDGTVRLWRPGNRDNEALLRMHDGAVYGAGFSSDGRRLVTVGRDKTIRIWNGTPGGATLEVTGQIERPSEAVFSPDSRRIVGRGPVGTTIWDLASGTQTATLPAQALRHAVFLDARRVVAHSGKLHIWDTESGAVTAVEGDHERLAFVAASQDRKRIALYGALHLWDAEGKEGPGPVDAELGLMSSAAFSPDGKRLAVTSTAGLHLIDPISRKQIAALEERDPTLESAAYSRDGQTLFVGSRTGILRALDAATLQPRYTWPLAQSAIIDLKASPDGRRLLAVTQNGIRIFDIATREEVAVLERPSATQAAFSPDGRFIATNSDFLRVWPAFPATQDLVDYARSVMPRPLTAQQRQDFSLDGADAGPKQ